MNSIDDLFLNITNFCNFHCDHCYTSSGKPFPNELSTDEVVSLLVQASQIGTGKLHFDGGEPILRYDFNELLEMANSLGMLPSIHTNGWVMSRERLEGLQGKLRKIVFSLDGAHPETHDSIRNKKGSYLRVINGIAAAKDLGFVVDVDYVVMSPNIGEIEQAASIADGLKVDNMSFYAVEPRGFARDNWNRLKMTEEQWVDYLKRVEAVAMENPRIRFEPAWVPKNQLHRYEFDMLCLQDENRVLFIEPTGNVYKCPMFYRTPIALGNVRAQRLADLVNGTPPKIKRHIALTVVEDPTSFEENCGCPALWLKLNGRHYENGPSQDFAPICFLVSYNGQHFAKHIEQPS